MRLPRRFKPQDPTEVERIAPTASVPPLDGQDYEVLIGLCETAMDEEPYTNRAMHLCRLIDKLEEAMLAL